MNGSDPLDLILWGVLPYVVLVIVVGGLVWRYRYDRFGWTTRSSELYESRLLRIGSPLFHVGLLFVILGHVVGLLVPESGPGRSGCPTPCTTSPPCRSGSWPECARSAGSPC